MNPSAGAIAILSQAISHCSTATASFRPFCRADAFPLHQAALDPKFNERLAWGPPADPSETLAQADLLLREAMQGRAVAVSVCEKHTGAWMGLAKLACYRDSLAQSLWFHPAYQRKPSLIFASSALVDLCFEEADLAQVYAKHAVGNETTEKLLLHNGYRFLCNEDVPHANGSQVPCKTYVLEKARWKSKTRPIAY